MRNWIKTGGAWRAGYCANMAGEGMKRNPYAFASPRWFSWDDGYTAAAYARIKQSPPYQWGGNGFAEMLITVAGAWLIAALLLWGSINIMYKLIMGYWL